MARRALAGDQAVLDAIALDHELSRMMQLEDLQPSAAGRGIMPDRLVTVVSVQWYGSEAFELTYKTPTGKLANEVLFRHDEPRLDLVEIGRPWSFDGDGARFRLVSEAARTGNWFLETNLVIARLDKLSRNEDVQSKLAVPDGGWDLIICDEAHKLAATVFGDEIKYTRRYKLGQLLSTRTRHFLLMTAAPRSRARSASRCRCWMLKASRILKTLRTRRSRRPKKRFSTRQPRRGPSPS